MVTYQGKPADLVIIRDITERKRAEEALRDSEEKWRSLTEYSPDYVMLLDRESRILFINHTLPGLTREQVIGTSIHDYALKEYEQPARECFKRVLQTGLPDKYESFYRYADGTLQCFESYVGPVRRTDEIVGLTISSRDVTERKRAEETLLESHERYSRLANSITDIFFAFDKDLKYTYWNAASEKLMKISAEEAIGKSLYDIFPDTPQTRIAEKKYWEVLKTGLSQVFVNEYKIGEKDYYFEMSVYPSKDGISVFTKDITERRRTEEALRRAEENFRYSLDGLPLGVRIVTAEGETIYANQAILDIYGFSSLEELRTTPVKKRYTPESYAEYQKRYERRQRGEDSPSEYEISIVRKNGEVRHLLVSRKELFWSGKKQYQTLYRDITEHKRAEEALRESEANLSSLVENAAGSIWSVDREYHVIIGNAQFYKNFELTLGRKSKKGDNALVETLPQAFRAQWRAYYDRALRGEAFSIETYVTLFKETRYMEYRFQPIRTSDGAIIGVTGVGRDISERKRAEEALRQSESRLRALSLELSFIEERERKRLALYLHDEIGQSLALLRMKFGSLTGIWGSKSRKQNIQQIRDLLEKVIDQTHALTFELSPPVLHQLGLEAAIEWAGEKISQDFGIEFMFSDDGRMKPLDADLLALMFRCVRELMMNIAKHAKARKMTVSLKRTQNHFTAVVEDNGIGFETPLSERQPEKVGFGLLSVRERLGAVGGSYEFQSEPGRGTRITLSVPLKEEMPAS
jgi:PAS domain S-box-containing protein